MTGCARSARPLFPASGLSEEMPVRAIVFDLDDTLVDTFESLIRPLEMLAASEMVSAGLGETNLAKVVETILHLRRDDPERIEEALSQVFSQLTARALEARRLVFTRATPDKLKIEPVVLGMLRELSVRYETYLLTVGRPDFQNRKVEQLGIRSLFKGIAILPSGSEETKERWLSALVNSGCSPSSVLVVGNRLDNEIRAGNSLGMRTVWVRRGEGSGLRPGQETAEPDYIIPDIRELPKVLAEIESSQPAHTSKGLEV